VHRLNPRFDGGSSPISALSLSDELKNLEVAFVGSCDDGLGDVDLQ